MVQAKIDLSREEVYRAIYEYVREHYGVVLNRCSINTSFGSVTKAEIFYELKKK
jgi:hypothetical protein